MKCPHCGLEFYPQESSASKKRAFELLEAACEFLKITPEALKAKCRIRSLVRKRKMVVSIIHNHTTYNPKSIGKMFNQDRTTVIHNSKDLSRLMFKDSDLRYDYNELKKHVLKK